MTQLLITLFLTYLPPIPALNKWLGNYPSLCWLVLGTLLHGILPRIWDWTIFRIAGIFEEPVGNDSEATEGEGINAFKRKRAKRANRIRDHMHSKLRRLHASVALFATHEFRRLLTHFQDDEAMYSPDRRQTDWGCWLPFQRPTPRNIPNLLEFMRSNQEPLRKLQTHIGDLLNPVNARNWIMHVAFDPLLGAVTVSAAIQHSVLELLGDLHLRFTAR